MALRKHTNKSYYYRTHRVDGRVTNQYLGRSPAAAQAAAEDAARIAAERAATERYEKINKMLDDYERVLRTLMQAHLVLNGYYLHKYQWRKRRVKSNPKSTPPKRAAQTQTQPPTHVPPTSS